MTPDKKLEFIKHMTKLGLTHVPHFDAGGVVPGQQTTVSTGGLNNISPGSSQGLGNPANAGQAIYNPQQFTNDIGSVGTGFSAAFTPQNQFQAQLAPTNNFNYAPGVGNGYGQEQAGAATVNNEIAQQQGTAGTLAAEAAGQGPNPAQAALSQNTGTNVANTAALMANTRGANANPGLIAAEAGQQGAATQQQAVGQAATLGAQQQLAAQQNLQAQQAAIAQEGQTLSSGGTQLFGAGATANNAQNANTVSNLNNAQTINAATAQNNTNATQKTESGLLGGVSSLAALFAEGGKVGSPKKYADGGVTSSNGRNVTVDPGGGTFSQLMPGSGGGGGGSGGPSSMVGKYLNGGSSASSGATDTSGTLAGGGDDLGAVGMLAARGGAVKAQSPKEKAKVDGDSYSNDKIPAELSEGEGVIDRETMNDPGPLGKMARLLMQHIEAKKKGKA